MQLTAGRDEVQDSNDCGVCCYLALLEPGRKVDVPGAPVSSNEDLNPAEIEALIQREPEVWAAKVRALDETMRQAKTAIAAQDVEALSEVGGYIDDACEGCHQHFWYPEN